MARIKPTAHVIRLMNISKQMIPLQVRPPQGDFYLHEQQVRINPGATVMLPKNHLRSDQLQNLQSRRMIRVIYDSEAVAEQATSTS